MSRPAPEPDSFLLVDLRTAKLKPHLDSVDQDAEFGLDLISAGLRD